MLKIEILQTGYNRLHQNGKDFLADCTVTLIKGKDIPTVLVDTSGPWNAKKLQDDLKKAGNELQSIDIVVCTHGHSDHVGNLNLFPEAKFIVGEDIFHHNVYEAFDFQAIGPLGRNRYYLSDNLSEFTPYVVSTPGHTCSDVSVVVKNPENGKVTVIAGDIFENEHDFNDSTVWQELSKNVAEQQKSRNYILSIADWIVPGHGHAFAVNEDMRPK